MKIYHLYSWINLEDCASNNSLCLRIQCKKPALTSEKRSTVCTHRNIFSKHMNQSYQISCQRLNHFDDISFWEMFYWNQRWLFFLVNQTCLFSTIPHYLCPSVYWFWLHKCCLPSFLILIGSQIVLVFSTYFIFCSNLNFNQITSIQAGAFNNLTSLSEL